MLERDGKPIPAWITNAPVIPDYCDEVWQAFWFLCGRRQVAEATNPIMATEMEAVMRLRGIADPDEIDEWLFLLNAMDDEFICVMREKHKAQMEAAKVAPKRR